MVRLLSLADLVGILGRSSGSKLKVRPGETAQALERRRERAAIQAVRAFIDREEQAGRFPRRVRLTEFVASDGRQLGSIRWEAGEIEAYLQKRLAARDHGAAA